MEIICEKHEKRNKTVFFIERQWMAIAVPIVVCKRVFPNSCLLRLQSLSQVKYETYPSLVAFH